MAKRSKRSKLFAKNNNIKTKPNESKLESKLNAESSELNKYVNEKIKGKNKKRIATKVILFLIFFSIFIFSVVNLIRWGIYNKKSSDLIGDIKKECSSNIEKSNNEEINKNPINFNSLKNTNSDTVGWIKIKDTFIDYPIVQTTDNEYYLHKDFNKKYSTCGWIFMDYKNSKSFIDKNTVLYGHNIKTGLMFADLQKILKKELGNEIVIEIYTPTEVLNYRVFSSYMEEPEDYATKSNIVEDDDQEKYIKEMLKRSTIIYNVVPDKSDKLLTLSTCDNTGKNRILVHSVYIGGHQY